VSDLVGIEVEERGDIVVARLTGELDLAGAPHANETITGAVPTSARGLVVDLTELEFIDSSGVSMLFGIARQLSSRRQRVHVAALPEGPVARVLELVDFQRAAPVHPDREGALRAAEDDKVS
jgi:anti-anti-sigma factor